jgi:hypothetical protein
MKSVACSLFLLWVCLGTGLTWPLPVAGAEPAAEAPQEAFGIDLGDASRVAYVVRDQATWEAVKKAVGGPQMLPIGMPKGIELQTLDKIDFEKKMIVALFWGEMSFSVQKEKCWIENVTVGKKEVTVDCRAVLWGGRVTAAYRAWPYHVRVIERSELPVKFIQTTEWKAPPGRTEKDKLLATLEAGEWKQEIKAK